MGFNNNEIVYPIFLSCIRYATDAFWKNIFEDLSVGKCPFGTYISKNFLCCSFKNKDFSYKIEYKDAKLLYDEVSNLLLNRAGILSSVDKNKKKQDFLTAEKTIKENRSSWADIKKKSVKDYLIELFVIDMKKQHNLSFVQTRKLLSLIMISFVFKTLGNKDIIFENNKIKHIDGIEFEDGSFSFTKDVYGIMSSELTPEIIIEKKILSDGWPKYYSSLTPRAIKQRLV